MQKGVWLQLAFIITQLCAINGDINNKLSYYELIDTPASNGRIRRSVYTNHKHEEDEELIKDFTIKAFNRTFYLQLKPRTEVFSSSFKISVVHADGSETIAPLQEGNFYMGTVVGEDNSEVHGYFEDGNFVGTVSVRGELFTFEPAWRHMKDGWNGINSGKIVAYRRSDIIWPENEKDGRKFCKSAHAPGENSNDSALNKTVSVPKSRREKRATPTKNTCKMFAVADFKFFKFIGASDIYRTASYIVGVIERTDRIFRQTNWGGTQGLTGMGIELEQIRIHDSSTSGANHYNQDKTDWEIQDLLNAFGLDQTLKNYCLGHLFTHESFANNVLGLAYIAPSRSGAGGICSPTRYIGSSEMSYNTGWTTTANTKGETVLLQQADLVTAHEIGHNWGSEHDPDTSECAPSTVLGDGKYLMYPFSVSGYDSNNFKFSTCSKAKVSAVLEAKAESCFEEPEPVTLCGNGILNEENGEECDAGFLGRYGQDKCCTSQCKLTPTSTCSPVNHECCLNCQRSPVGTVCRNDTFTSCKRVGYCDGVNLNCPAPVNADDDTACIDGGTCQGGQCLGFCEAKGLLPCLCDDVETSCLRCCRNETHGLCKQTDPQTFLSDGRPCAQGYCLSGTCKKAAQSVIERLFNLIDKITLNSVLIFFQDNIVGCVMVFTLLIWIPISCCITYRDRQREKRFRNEFDIEPRCDRQFTFDEDKRKVRVPDHYLRPRTPKEIFVAKAHKRY